MRKERNNQYERNEDDSDDSDEYNSDSAYSSTSRASLDPSTVLSFLDLPAETRYCQDHRNTRTREYNNQHQRQENYRLKLCSIMGPMYCRSSPHHDDSTLCRQVCKVLIESKSLLRDVLAAYNEYEIQRNYK